MVSLICRILKKKKKGTTHWNKVEKWLPEDEGGVHREKLVKGFKVSVRRLVNSEDLLYNMVIIVDDTLLHNCDFFKRVKLKYSHMHSRKRSTWGNGYNNELDAVILSQ